MQQIHLDEPKPEEVTSEAEVEVKDWFSAPPFAPSEPPWQWLTREHSKELWRLSRYFQRLFNFGGDWFSASRDRPARIAAFRDHVLATAEPEQQVYLLHGTESAVFTDVVGFLECWPRLQLLEREARGYDMLPLDLSFWLQVNCISTAHIAERAA